MMAKKAKSMAEMLSLPSFTSMFTLTMKPRRKKPKKAKYKITYSLFKGGVRSVVPERFHTRLAAEAYSRSIARDDAQSGLPLSYYHDPKIRRVK